MKAFNFKVIMVLFLAVFAAAEGKSQSVPQGINYQGIALNTSNAVIAGQAIGVKIGIYAPAVTGTLEWEETYTATTNQFGLFNVVIGQGTSTGAGSVGSFAAINWGAAAHFFKISIDQAGGGAYVAIDTIQFWSVPYAMYSGKAASVQQPLRLDQLSDVDTMGVVPGYLLKWNGSLWTPAPDNNSDTALYAYNAMSSVTSDTAQYALNSLSTVDTVPYSLNSDSSLYAVSSGTAVNATYAGYSDTATYALNSVNAWNTSGNSGTSAASNFVGTTDNTDLVFRTNNLERMRITSAGRVGIGTTSPTASLHIVGTDGIIAQGTFGTGALPPTGGGTRMFWYPKKGAFRAGGVLAANWDDGYIGNYSFAAGYNTRAAGAYSTAFGSSALATGAYTLAAGDQSQATATSAVAMGSVCYAQGAYSVALGRSALASDTGSVAIGYTLTSSGYNSLAFGAYTTASGDYSVAMGWHASTNGMRGSFVYADESSTSVTNNTVNNQFMVRASGGTIFYSNTALTTGVSLAAGGGAWSAVSDKHKKENFKKVQGDAILAKIAELPVSTWNYKTQPGSIRHMGPMAQDFYAAFQLGESDTTITTVDMDGVSLAAIQALALKTKELQAKADEVEKLKAQIALLESDKKKLEHRISSIEKQLNLLPSYTASVPPGK
jgi:hypothetical protein